MSELLEALQRRHREKLDQMQADQIDEAFLEELHLLIADLREAGAIVADPAERGQLRALLRFWAGVAHQRTGVYPDTTLPPADPARARPVERPSRRGVPLLTWVFIAIAVAVIAAIALLVGGSLPGAEQSPPSPPPPRPTTVPAPVFGRVLIGEALTEEGAVAHPRETFCLGASEVVAELTLEGIHPQRLWHWEVWREGQMVASQPEEPWGQSGERVALPVLPDGGEGLGSGRYELRVYAGERLVASRAFRILATAPRVSDLRVADVPEPGGEAASGDAFEPGLRVVYLTYAHEGMCPGLEVSHTLYRGGDAAQAYTRVWSAASRGEAQISFQAPDSRPFAPGDYEIVVSAAGEEQGRLGFTVVGAEAEEEVEPAVGDLTVALGVEPDGSPILAASDTGFDWNTKAVYAIFDYVGMREGARWSAVWTRGEEEVAREGGLWDAEAFGTEGTYWVSYHADPGRTLSGGDYAVTLAVDGVTQGTAEFNVLYYTPSE